ncbi:helix-turn-helix domain-containing protein, partial [Thalassotalea sp. G20_0]|uniref:helix-turn-helix transcriptional regulator n=1 Tax=Thalassotalea sp. G20_0 TaxID=2821093 RepID=UPI001AD9E52E
CIIMNQNAIANILRDLTKVLDCFYEPLPFDIKRDEMLTMDEVCHRLKIHRNTLRGWLKKGSFPAPIDVSGQQRWPTSMINARIYEDNPHLREQEYLMVQAQRISKSVPDDHERLLAEARRIAKSEKSGAAA